MSQELSSRIRSPSGKPLLVQEPQDIIEAWHSDQMKEIRRQMINAERPFACQNCFQQEDLGQTSYRESMNQSFSVLYEDLIAKDASEAPDFKPLSLDLRISNLCNLKCRMCAPWSSRLLKKEWESFYPMKNVESASGLTQQILDFLLQHSGAIQHLRLAGGEPFLIKELFVFLESLVKSGASSNIDLSINTNLTVFPENYKEIFKSFRNIVLAVSLDGFGPLNNYIRYPANWDEIVTNISSAFTFSREVKPLDIRIQTTVQIYNIFKLNELYRFLDSEFALLPQLNFLNSPVHLSIQALPNSLKDKAARRLVEIEGEYPFNKDVLSIRKFLYAKNEAHHFEDFWRWTEHLDRTRTQNSSEFLPFEK